MRSGVNPSHYLPLLLVIVYFTCGVNGQESPCPSVFDYKFDGIQWYGTITLPSVGRGRTNLVVTLSIEDNLSKDNAGQVILLNDISTIYSIVDSGGLLEYKVNFPISEHIPTIKSIQLNKIEYCNSPSGLTTDVQSTITVIHSFQTDSKPGGQLIPQPQPVHRPQPQPIPRPVPQPIPRPVPQSIPRPVPQSVPRPVPPQSSNIELHSRPTQNDNDAGWLSTLSTTTTCGFRKEPGEGTGPLMPVHTIIGGVKVEPGEYPWLVVLKDQAMIFICGGSLVSTKHIITAAHCIQVRWLYVELGRYNREDSEEDFIFRIARDIVIHPDYKPNTGHSDIAILTLSEEVQFSDKIKPICIWPFGPGGIGLNGAVVGWGTDQSGDPTPKIMQTAVDIVSKEKCLAANELFGNITSEYTYCAGGQGTGPCKGDSGGGMYINLRNRWYLRGIISTSLGSGGPSCNVNLYAVYADIATFLGWLKTYLA